MAAGAEPQAMSRAVSLPVPLRQALEDRLQRAVQ